MRLKYQCLGFLAGTDSSLAKGVDWHIIHNLINNPVSHSLVKCPEQKALIVIAHETFMGEGTWLEDFIRSQCNIGV